VYRDIIECSQAGDGRATAPPSYGPWYLIGGLGPAQRHDKMTRILALMTAVSVAGSAADALNALAVLQEWLQESPLVFI